MARDSLRSPISPAARTLPSTLAQSKDGSSPKSSAFDKPALLAQDLHKGRRLCGVSFSVADGETLVILGPSGAGKTSLLRLIAGLEAAESGSLALDGRDLLGVAPQHRRVAFVFQDDALFPHMTVYENLAFALRMKRARASEIDARVRDVASALDIAAHLRHRPARLSGGERQRAALARAVLSDPRVLLLDEPLAHLDPQLRVHVREQFAHFRKSFPGVAVYVTHDHVEALAVADLLAVLMNGRIEQLGAPQTVYDYPANVRVARFLGSPPMNVLDGDECLFVIRPEHVLLDAAAPLRGRVLDVRSSGPDRYVHVRTQRGELIVRSQADLPAFSRGDEVGIRFAAAHVRRFDRSTGALLP